MPLKLGSTSISAVYQGSTKIGKIYKGATLVYSSAYWLTQAFTNLYYSLIPQTISGKTVQDKAKLGKIYGNGVIENQLISNALTSGTYNDLTVSVDNGKITVNGTASALTQLYVCATGNRVNLISGHKYFCYGLFKTNGSSTTYDFRVGTNIIYGSNSFFTSSANSEENVYIVVRNGQSVNFTIEPQLIDLTLKFGTGNEPTTTSDERIANILNGDYTPYDTGTYEPTQIRSILSEPYNLFDGVFEIGYIVDGGNYDTLKYCLRSKNYTSVKSNTNYTFSVNNNFRLIRIDEFDENYTYIKENVGGNSNSLDITTTSTTKYIKLTFANSDNTINYEQSGIPALSITQPCFHRTGTRTGYAENVEPSLLDLNGCLQLNGAIDAHDTFEVTNTDCIFTNNIGSVDLGTLEWVYDSSHTRFYSQELSYVKAPIDNNTIANILCDKYTTMIQQVLFDGSDNNAISFSSGSRISVRDTAYTDATTFATAMSGTMLYYELATPQVITIPKKHLACVDLGTLNWSKGTRERFINNSLNSLVKKPISDSVVCNIVCSKLLTNSAGLLYSHTNKNSIAINDGGTMFVYIDDDYYNNTDITTFKNAMSGIYLFYETEDEVTDFTNLVNAQYGGTLTGIEYSYVENQLVQASNLLPTSSFTQYGVTFSRNTADKSVTISGLCTTSMTIDITSSVSITSGHIYWLFSGIEGTDSTYHIVEVNSNKKSYQGSIFTLSNSTAKYAIYINSGYNISLTFKPQIVDLTLMFGSGNEPTSVNDDRMKDLINSGYIEYNATGTSKNKPCSVLPNADIKLKCK